MVLARSNRGTIGGHAPIISIHDTWCAEDVTNFVASKMNAVK